MSTGRMALMVFLILGCGIPAARAQFAVIDVASVTQLISQVNTLEQQLATARDDLAQTKAAYQSTVGGRGMEQLLSGTVRNYLPATWSSLQGAFQGGGGILSLDLAAALQSNAILPQQVLAGIDPAVQRQLQSQRQSVALLQAVSHEELATTSSRFASLSKNANCSNSLATFDSSNA